MKKSALLLVVSLFLFASAAASFADAPFHIGIATLTVSQAEDTYRGAEYMVKKYGDTSSGGMIKHITMPDNFMQEMETTISQIAGLADDPKIKAIVVVEAIPGTTEALRRVKEKRKDIICLTGSPQEDPNVISSVADYSVASDKIIRGYLNIYAAKKLGAKTFVIISFPRHMSYELQARRRAIFEEACKDLGLKYVFETAPDPVSDVGVAGAQQFILEKVPAWINKYGKDTAFFCTNDAQTEPLLRQVAKYGAIFIEPDLPSPLMGISRCLWHRPQERGGQLAGDNGQGRKDGHRGRRKRPDGNLLIFAVMGDGMRSYGIWQADRRKEGEAREAERSA